MAKALDFIDPDKLSMTVILTAMNRFLNETNGLQMAFLDGNQPERLCAPLQQYIEARGGEVRLNSALRRFELAADGSVAGLRMAGKDGKARTAARALGGSPPKTQAEKPPPAVASPPPTPAPRRTGS